MAADFTFLSDFDGVWTDPWRELQEVHLTVRRELGRLGGVSDAEMDAAYDGFRRAVLASPQEHGWRIDGRLSSYVDEDYFAVPTSIGQYIDLAPCHTSQGLRESVLARYGSVLEFLDHCYHSTCARFREEVEHDLTPGSRRVMRWLLDQGVQVVFATNAPGEKVVQWFGHHGFPVADAREVGPGEAPLRVYGRAGKQWIGDAEVVMEFSGRAVHVDRPQYREILEREQADLVLGDVLSLDLALPLSLRAGGSPGAPGAVGVMHLPHTPEWVHDSVGPTLGQVDFMLSHITELPRHIMRLRG